ncbi:hypothetical protein PDJAM_G00050650 [Pangasius djambal]|uniref:Uncharacterized protein n=1 Tax=Pangasius djambal TaxID=1691987 RepID=A0ACC5YXU7_9TELE|nr:hypothetical protein [Pangasius djambal]
MWRISEGALGHTADVIHSSSSLCNFFHICQARNDTRYVTNKWRQTGVPGEYEYTLFFLMLCNFNLVFCVVVYIAVHKQFQIL